MKVLRKTATSVMIAFAVLLSSIGFVNADDHSAQDARSTHHKVAAPTVQYRLTLSLAPNTNGWSPNVPYVNFDISNSTEYTMLFFWSPDVDANLIVFNIEYKPMTNDTSLDTGWIRIKPVVKPASNVNSPRNDFVLKEVDDQHRLLILPGQSGQLSFSPDVPMSEKGLYRITATLTVPEASEYSGAISPSTKVRSFNLVVHSQPLIIRHTADGFVPVNTTANKQAVPK